MGSMLRIESANLKPALHSLLMSDHARQQISIVLGSMFPNMHIAGNLKALLGIDLDSRGSKPNISPRKATRWAQDHSSSHSGQARVATWKGSLPRSSSKWNTDQRWQYNQNSHSGEVKPPHCLGLSSNENGFSSRDGKARRWPCRPAEATDGSQALPLQFRVGKWMLSKRSSKLYKADPPAIVRRPRVEGPSQSKKDSVHPLNITPSCNQTRLN